MVRKVKRSESGMILDPVTLDENATLGDALRMMREYNIGGIPVTNGDRKAGRHYYQPRYSVSERYYAAHFRNYDPRKPDYRRKRNQTWPKPKIFCSNTGLKNCR